MTLDEFASKLQSAKPHKYKGQSAYVASCPGHEDKHPSFMVWEGADGWLHVKCQSGCDESRIETALGIKPEDRRVCQIEPQLLKTNSTVYSYYDLDGLEAFAKVRLVSSDGKKTFRQYVRFDTEGKAVPKVGEPKRFPYPSEVNLNGRGNLLYRLPEVLAAARLGHVVYVNEGEKACEAFRLRGYVATCQPAGAGPGKWKDEHTAALRGATVVIVADYDKVGFEYAREVAAVLLPVARSVRVVQSKTAGDKDDAWDHFNAGFTVDEFVRRSDLEPPRNISTITSAATVVVESVDWLLYPLVPMGMITLVEGDPGVGKSFLTCALAAAVSVGAKLPFFEDAFPKANVLLYATEDTNAHTTVPRLVTAGADLSLISLVDEVVPLDRTGLDRLRNDILESGAKLVIIDPISAFIDAVIKSPRPSLDTHAIMVGVKQIAESTGAAIIGIRHMRKSNTQDTNAIYSGIGDIAIAGKARSILQVRRNPDQKGQCIISHIKSNVGPLGDSVAYELKPSDQHRGMASLMWIGTSDYDPVKAQAERLGNRLDKKTAECELWLQKTIQGGAYESNALKERAIEAGFTYKTYRSACENVCVSERDGGTAGKWFKRLRNYEDPFAD